MVSTQPPTPAPPRRRDLRIAVVVWAVLVLGLVALAGFQFVGYTSQPEDQHIPLAGGTVTITEPGEYSVYYETSRESYGELTGITGPDSAAVPARPATVSETYTVNERAGVKLGTFTAATPGTYTLTGTAQDIARSDELVVGTRTVGAILGMVVTGVAASLVLVGGGVVLLIVFLVGRSRNVPSWSGAPVPPGSPQPGPYAGAPHAAPRYPGHPYPQPHPQSAHPAVRQPDVPQPDARRPGPHDGARDR